MNNKQLIEKIIRYSSDTCPPFNHENPLLDPNVSRALAKSFVKILQDAREDTPVNINIRRSVLENIRKLCTIEPENHIKLSDDLSQVLMESYQNKLKDSPSAIDKMLDEFLIKQTLGANISSRFENSISPETIQALLNLDVIGNLEILSKDMIHWNTRNEKYYNVLKDLWNNNLSNLSKESIDNLCIKIKPEIERIILEQTLAILESTDLNMGDVFSANCLVNITKTCALSPICFQICIGTLNCLLISCNFDNKILAFIHKFIGEVKKNCLYISTLYPIQLSSAIVILDIDFTGMPKNVKDKYVEHGIEYIQNVHKQSESDLILVLSHYPQWFDIYFHDINERSDDEGN